MIDLRYNTWDLAVEPVSTSSETKNKTVDEPFIELDEDAKSDKI